MNYKRVLSIIVGVMWCGIVIVNAQTTQAGNTYLYFADALAMAEGKNLTLKAHGYQMNALEYDKKAQFGLRLPQFELVGNFTLMNKPIGLDFNEYKAPLQDILDNHPNLPVLPIVNDLLDASWELNFQENNFAVLGVGMAIPIYMGGKINAANNVAKIRIEEGENKYNQELGALCSELAERYFGLSLAQQAVLVRDDVVIGMQKHYDDAVAMEKNGIIAQGERLHAEMFLSRAKADKQKSIRDVLTINAALGNTLNAKGNYAPITAMFILSEIESIDYFITNALDKSPLLKEVGFMKRLAHEQKRAKLAEILPMVSIVGAANIVDYNVTDIIPQAFIGVSVTYKLFNGAKNIYEFKSSKETIKRVETLQEQAKIDIVTLTEKDYNNLMSLAEQVRSYDSTIDFAKEYLRIKTKAFGEGMATSTDVVDAQLNLAKSKIEQIQLAYNYDVALANLLELCGLSDRYLGYMLGVAAEKISYK